MRRQTRFDAKTNIGLENGPSWWQGVGAVQGRKVSRSLTIYDGEQ